MLSPYLVVRLQGGFVQTPSNPPGLWTSKSSWCQQKKEVKASPHTKVIWDVFKDQMTDMVKSKLTSSSIDLVAVLANMTQFFQSLDLTVNGAAKKLAWKEFTQYYSTAVQQQLQNGKV